MPNVSRTPPKSVDTGIIHAQSEPDMQKVLMDAPDISNISLRQKRPRMDLSPGVIITARKEVPETRPNTPTGTDTTLLLSEIRLLRQQVSDLKQQNTEIDLKLSNVSDTLNQKLEHFGRKLELQDNEIILLRNCVSDLQHKLNINEQNNLRNELEIVGINEESNENLVHITLLTAKKIGVDLLEADIDEVYRAGPRRSNLTGKPRSIVLRLTRRVTRSRILKAARERRPLSTDDIIKGTSNNVYINERLTTTNRQLFRETRARAQNRGFQYCWVRNGTIYVRKAENHPSMSIRAPTDLDEKIGCLQVEDTTYLDKQIPPPPMPAGQRF